MNSTSSFRFLIIFFIKYWTLIFGNLVDKLVDDVTVKYMNNASCLVVASDGSHIGLGSYENTVLRLDTSGCPDKLNREALVSTFGLKCDHYVIATGDPSCFLNVWMKAKDLTDNRHTPKMFFIVTNQSEIDHVLKHSAAHAYPDIVVAVYNQKKELDWPVTFYTNVLNVRNGCHINDTIVAEIDQWSVNKSFNSQANLYPDKMSNFGGCALRLNTFTYLPYTNVEPLDGTEIRIVKEFCRVYNCGITVIDDGHLWGSVWGDGKGDGLFGMVYTSMADMGAAANAVWLENYRYLDYSTPYFYTTATVLVPGAKPLSGWMVPFLPFGLPMWGAFVLTLIANSLLLYLITAATIKFTGFGEEVKRLGHFTDLADSILRSIGMSVLQQPSKLVPGTPIRHLFTSFEFLFLILTTCYSAELSSYLTVPQYTEPIKNIHELAKSKMHWVADDEVWILALKSVEDPDVQTIVKNFEVMGAEQMMKIAPSGKFALAIESLASGGIVFLSTLYLLLLKIGF